MTNKKYKDYEENTQEESIVSEPSAGYLITTSRNGIPYNTFTEMTLQSPFNLHDWSMFLHLSEKTIQRYKKEKKSFDPLHSEKIMQITMLYNRGVEVFGSKNNFNVWLDSTSIALGGVKPKELLDNAFGISLLNNELTKIEHGILA
jgi:putative toxin-antitoxin system antitoxin component (TIGR02293 family)